MASAIARIYANSIEKGNKKFEDVPDRIKEEVLEILIADGFEIND